MSTGRNLGARRWRYFCFALAGVAAGGMGMALGAFLASGDNRWEYGMYHSAAGIVAAPLAALAWATHRYRRGQTLAGIALVIGLLSGMTMLFELSEEHAPLSATMIRSPVAISFWLSIWSLWVSLALLRLMIIRPTRHVRQRLSSHH